MPAKAVAEVRNNLRVAQNQMIFAELETAYIEANYGQVVRNGNDTGRTVDFTAISIYALAEAVFQNAERLVDSIQTRLTKCLAEKARVENAISNCDPFACSNCRGV
jgi:hypothetical protein